VCSYSVSVMFDYTVIQHSVNVMFSLKGSTCHHYDTTVFADMSVFLGVNFCIFHLLFSNSTAWISSCEHCRCADRPLIIAVMLMVLALNVSLTA